MANLFIQGIQPAIGFEQITVSSVGIGCTPTTFETFESTNQTRKQAKFATLTIENNSIRVRFDGTDPTSSVGHLLTAGQSFELQSIGQIRNCRMIRQTADAIVTVTYFGS
jgi:hypothetical protein